jgi:hypothetical protein
MEPETLRQVRGGVELGASAVEATVVAVAEAHRAIMRQVYTPFEQLGPLAEPAHMIEQVQSAITGFVYLAILGVSRIVTRGAVALLDHETTRG